MILTATFAGAALGVLANLITLGLSALIYWHEDVQLPVIDWSRVALYAFTAAVVGAYVGLLIGVGIWVFGS